ncbi:hypothetical protein SAMN05878503_104138 [Cereibacter ovatus]|uniref:Uncharacterized protein n=1 Tax=Cereibacter ovatus TaxID=439529 RepID=A0A285CQ46_9RHOB|nr:hypothetical protein [Cereibacter ovatus]SNX69634.1 hypothetical protein SAMN05878503_104138 [Cereibacter ovatus]
MGCMITALRPLERVRQDGEAIAAMYREMGVTAAEQVVNRALGELALTIAGLAQQVRGRSLTDVPRRLRRLQRLAENLGMVSLGLVAGDARTAFASGDMTAFAAVWARLIRIAERSLAMDRELLDRSI